MLERIFKGVVLFFVVGFLCWFIYDYVSTTKELGELKVDRAVLQTKYDTAAEAQKASEQTISQLRQDATELMQALEQWKAQYDEIERKNTTSQRRIR